MVERFVGRREELRVLEEAYASQASALVPVYGRRRVGKSELILRFSRDKRVLYVLGKQAPAPLQIRELLQEAARVLDEPLLEELGTRDWKQVLERHPGVRVHDLADLYGVTTG